MAKQRTYDANVKLDVKASYIGSKIFEADHLCKRFGDLKILDDFSYIFARYEKMGIVGNNGTGKSTFIKILMGLENPTAVRWTSAKRCVSATTRKRDFSLMSR